MVLDETFGQGLRTNTGDESGISNPVTQPDPERRDARVVFQQVVEPQVFETPANQNELARLYSEQVTKFESVMKGVALKGNEPKLALLQNGDIVYRGGVYQFIKKPYVISVHSVDYDFATSKQLPDGSLVQFPPSLLQVAGRVEILIDGRGYAECSYCGSAYPTDKVTVFNGKIVNITNAECPHCAATSPSVVKQ